MISNLITGANLGLALTTHLSSTLPTSNLISAASRTSSPTLTAPIASTSGKVIPPAVEITQPASVASAVEGCGEAAGWQGIGRVFLTLQGCRASRRPGGRVK